jgi:peptide/nickel transport system substrate-binding protein
MLDTDVPASAVPGLGSDPAFHIWPGADLTPYLVFNLLSPNSHHAANRRGVRRAIEFAVNKAAIQRIFGGPSLAKVINSVVPPGNLGHTAANPYPSAGNRGNAARCRAELRSAGYPHGLKLKFLYQQDSTASAVFAAVKASLAKCGIRLVGDPVSTFAVYLKLSNPKQNSKPGAYDLGVISWDMDWYGNDGRANLDPLFRTQCRQGSINYGCYSNPAVNKAMTAAERASTPQQAGHFWAQAARQIMSDAAIVPLTDVQSPVLSSARVREAGLRAGVVYAPNLGGTDITNVWLAKH